MLPKLTSVAAIIALLTEPTFAQPGSSGLTRPTTPEPSQAQIEQQKAEEKAYQSAVSRIPDPAQKSVDPWGDVRSTPSMPAKKKKQQ